MKRTLILAAICFGLCAAPRPAHAYWDDVHYHLTYYLARKSGFTPEQAYRLAAANLSTDYDAAVKPDQLSPMDLAYRVTMGVKGPPSADKQAAGWKFHAFRNETKYPGAIGPTGGACLNCRNAEQDVELQQNFLYRKYSTYEWKDNDFTIVPGNAGPFFHFLQDGFSHQGFGSAWGHYFDPNDVLATAKVTTKAKLSLGGATDWLSYHPWDKATDSNVSMALATARQLNELIQDVSPRQKPRPLTIADFQTVLDEMRRNNPAPAALTDQTVLLYKQYGASRNGLASAPSLIPELEADFKKHYDGPDLAASAAAVNAALKTEAIEMKQVPDYNLARQEYNFDAEGNVLPNQGNKWTLVGELKITVNAGDGVQGIVDVVIKSHPTMTGEAQTDLTKPVQVRAGGSATWSNIPVGIVEIEITQGGKILKSHPVDIDKMRNEVIIGVLGLDDLSRAETAMKSLGMPPNIRNRIGYPDLWDIDGKSRYMASHNPAPLKPGTSLNSISVDVYTTSEVAKTKFEKEARSLETTETYIKWEKFQLANSAIITTDPTASNLQTAFYATGDTSFVAGRALVVFLCGQVVARAGVQSASNNDKALPSDERTRLGTSAFPAAKKLAADLAKALEAQGFGSANIGGTSTGTTGITTGTATTGTGTTANPPAGTVAVIEVNGPASYQDASGNWQPLASGLSLGGRTGVKVIGGTVRLRLPGGTEITVSGQSMVDDGAPGGPSVSLVSGGIQVVRQRSGPAFTVRTPNATVTDKNTRFKVTYDIPTQTTTVTVDEGSVLVTPSDVAQQPAIVSAGKSTQVSPRGITPPTGDAPRSGEHIYNIDVPASRAWTATGIILKPNYLIKVEPFGSIDAAHPGERGIFYHSVPPGGRGQLHPEKPFPLLGALCMVARIGDGPAVRIGASKVWYAGGLYGTGELFLGINDDELDDNSGSWQVKITVNDGTHDPSEVER
jgi:hypothetical protein